MKRTKPTDLSHEPCLSLQKKKSMKCGLLPLLFMVVVGSISKMIDQFKKKLEGWKGKWLSMGGRIRMLKAVL